MLSGIHMNTNLVCIVRLSNSLPTTYPMDFRIRIRINCFSYTDGLKTFFSSIEPQCN